jgi:hypothetical protein
MNSFIDLSKSHTTNLAVVAPGIAEALLATALGLAAFPPWSSTTYLRAQLRAIALRSAMPWRRCCGSSAAISTARHDRLATPPKGQSKWDTSPGCVKPDSTEKYRFIAFSRAITHSQVNIERIV